MFNRFIAINTENSRLHKSGDFFSKSSRERAGRSRFFSTGFPSTDASMRESFAQKETIVSP